jgi:hypothetical protein
MRWWDWRGATALVLALGVAIAISVTLVGAVLSSHVVSAEETSLISGVIGAAVGAVATYLGGWGRDPRPPSEGGGEGSAEEERGH